MPRAVGVSAVLLCFWLYAQVGASLPAVPDAHPYAAWLQTYRDPGFVTATEAALSLVERELAATSPAVRARVTGTGCLPAPMTAAYTAVETDAFRAAVSATTWLDLAGEVAAGRAAGPGSFRMHLLDGLDEVGR